MSLNRGFGLALGFFRFPKRLLLELFLYRDPTFARGVRLGLWLGLGLGRDPTFVESHHSIQLTLHGNGVLEILPRSGKGLLDSHRSVLLAKGLPAESFEDRRHPSQQACWFWNFRRLFRNFRRLHRAERTGLGRGLLVAGEQRRDGSPLCLREAGLLRELR